MRHVDDWGNMRLRFAFLRLTVGMRWQALVGASGGCRISAEGRLVIMRVYSVQGGDAHMMSKELGL
jgi:hypothetical protein